MTFEQYIEKKFEQNLELAHEELELHNCYEDVECRAWRFATEWTQDEVINEIGRYFGNKWAARQEGINKVFYD